MPNYENRASLTYNSHTKNSNTVSFQVNNSLSFTKTALATTYKPDDEIAFVLDIINSTDTSYPDIKITDDLGLDWNNPSGVGSFPLLYVNGSVRYYKNGILAVPPTASFSVNGTTFTGLSILPNETSTLIYEVYITEYAPFEIVHGISKTITSTATLSSNQGDGNYTKLAQESVTITADSFTAPSLTKSLFPSTIIPGKELTYTFILNNYGNILLTEETWYTGIIDTFTHPFTITNVTYNGVKWTESDDYSYNQDTREFKSINNKISIPAATYQIGEFHEFVTVPGTSILIISGTVS